MNRRSQTVSIAGDDRARIPFALIAVLLLVSSATVVGVLESREEPVTDATTDLAMDRVEAVAAAETRAAVRHAADEAAAAPVTSTGGADPAFAAALGDGDVFEEYLSALVYREVAASLETADQPMGDGVTGRASLERVDWTDADELEGMLDRVMLEAGDGTLAVEVSDVDLVVERDGKTVATDRRDVTVTVATTVLDLHERVVAFEEDLNAGFFEADEFYDGFGRHFAARLYPYVWGKAYVDRFATGDRSFDNLTPNDHTEVLANDAVVALQEENFGTSDPYADRASALPTLCLIGDLASDVSDVAVADLLPEGEWPDAEALCDAALVDDEGEFRDPPTVREVATSLLEDHVDADVEIQAHPFADVAYLRMLAGYTAGDLEATFNESLAATERFGEAYLSSYFDDEVDNADAADAGGLDGAAAALRDLIETSAPVEDHTGDAIERVYDADVTAVESGPFRFGSLPEPTPAEEWADDPGNWSGPYDLTYLPDRASAEADVSIDLTDGSDAGFDDRDLATVAIDYAVDVRVASDWHHVDENRSDRTRLDRGARISYGASYEIDTDLAPDGLVAQRNARGIDDPFGRDDWDESYDPVANFEGLRTDAIREAFDLSASDPRRQENELERRLERAGGEIVLESDLAEAIDHERNPSVDVRPRDERALYDWLRADLERTHYELVTGVDPHRTDLWTMLDEPSPLAAVSENVAAIEDALVYENASEPYANVADLLRAEVRERYVENVHDVVAEVADHHADAVGEGSGLFDDAFGGALEAGNDLLSGPIDFVDATTDPETRPEDGRTTVEGSPLLEDVSYQVDASPTYLSLEAVDRNDVPAVRPEGGGRFDLDAGENRSHAALAAGYLNAVGHPGLPLLPWPSLFFLQADAYAVGVAGEYARFEVHSTDGDPVGSGETTYVRQAETVSLEVPKSSKPVAVGSVEPVSFDNRLLVPVVVPSPQLAPRGTPGVGDAWPFDEDVPREACSPAWGDVGPGFDDDGGDACLSDEIEGALSVGEGS